MLFFHFIGLAMGLGTGFAHAFLGSLVKKMTTEEATRFRMHSLVLGRMGHTGITLLLISGFYLMTPFWKTLPSNPLLIAKLSLVLVLTVLLVLIAIATRKAKQGDVEQQLKKMEVFGKLTLVTALAIVILAVSVFH